jgi:hypothetical protein
LGYFETAKKNKYLLMTCHASFGVLVNEGFPKEHCEIIRSRDQSFRGITSHCFVPFKSDLHTSQHKLVLVKQMKKVVSREKNLLNKEINTIQK